MAASQQDFSVMASAKFSVMPTGDENCTEFYMWITLKSNSTNDWVSLWDYKPGDLAYCKP